MENVYGINIILSQSTMDDSLSEDQPVTFDIRDVPLEKALSLLLVHYNATFYIDDGILIIISQDDAFDSRYMRVKMYNCRNLISALNSSVAGKAANGNRGGSGMGMGVGGMGGGGMGLGGGAVGGAGMSENRPGVNSKEDLLLDLVYTMIEPQEWEFVTGNASAKIVNGVLIVKHRQSAFEEIESLLRDLVYQVNTTKGFGNVENPVSKLTPLQGRGEADLFGSGSTTETGKDPLGSGETGSKTSAANASEDPFGR